MAISLIAHTIVNGATGGTTPPITTTGASLLVCCVATAGSTSVITDSFNNVWVSLSVAGDNVDIRDYCAINPIVGPNHTFTIQGVAVCMCVAAFSNMNTVDPVDQSAIGGTATGATGVAPGEINPSTPLELFVTAYATNRVGINNVSDAFLITDSKSLVAGVSFGCAMAYKISSLTENPLWNNTGAGADESAVMTTFFSNVASGTSVTPVIPMLLANGTLAGSPVPLTCSVGASPDFYDVVTRTLYTCVAGQYAIAAPPGALPLLRKGLFNNLPIFANNAAAKAGGLVRGMPYRTNGDPALIAVVK